MDDDFSNRNKIGFVSTYKRTINNNNNIITISDNSDFDIIDNVIFYKKEDKDNINIIFDNCELRETNIFLDKTIYECNKISNIIFTYDYTKIIYDKQRNVLIFYTDISFKNILGTEKPIELSIDNKVKQPLILVIDNHCRYKFLNNNNNIYKIYNLYDLFTIYQKQLNIKFDIKTFPKKFELITDNKCIKGYYTYALLYNCKCEYNNSITFNTNTNVHIFFNECTLSSCNIISKIGISDENFLKISNINFSNKFTIDINNNELLIIYHKINNEFCISTNKNSCIDYNNKELNIIKIELIDNGTYIINFYVNYNKIENEKLIIEIINELCNIYKNITYIGSYNKKYNNLINEINNKLNNLIKIKGLEKYDKINDIYTQIINTLISKKLSLEQNKILPILNKKHNINRKDFILTLLNEYLQSMSSTTPSPPPHQKQSVQVLGQPPQNPSTQVNQSNSSPLQVQPQNPIVQNTGNNSSNSSRASSFTPPQVPPQGQNQGQPPQNPSTQVKPPIQPQKYLSSSDSDFDYFFLQEQEEELKKKFKTKGGMDSYQNRKSSFLNLFQKL